MSFAAMTPEVISTQMYTGPGAGPLLAAATAWERVGTQLAASATAFQSQVAALVGGPWLGPSSVSMATAVTPYIHWMTTTAALAAQTAAQATAAATAYEAAFAAVVPPPVIAANRAELASLVATNVLGQNMVAIAATEAAYEAMWAQDVAAMTNYSAAAASATRLTPFSEPSRTGNGAPGSAAATLTGPVSAARSAVPTALAAAPDNPLSSLASAWQSIFGELSSSSRIGTVANVAMSATNFGMVEFKVASHPAVGLLPLPKSGLGAGLGETAAVHSGGLMRQASPAAVSPATAGLGRAPAVGGLSVPPSWASATPAIRLVAAEAGGSGLAAVPAADAPGGWVNPAALGSLTGGAVGSSAPRIGGAVGLRVRAGKDGKSPVQLDEVISQLKQRRDLVQHWHVEQDGLDDLLAKLSTKAGLHAVHVTSATKTPNQEGAM